MRVRPIVAAKFISILIQVLIFNVRLRSLQSDHSSAYLCAGTISVAPCPFGSITSVPSLQKRHPLNSAVARKCSLFCRAAAPGRRMSRAALGLQNGTFISLTSGGVGFRTLIALLFAANESQNAPICAFCRCRQCLPPLWCCFGKSRLQFGPELNLPVHSWRRLLAGIC
jgi:hypothetical protein